MPLKEKSLLKKGDVADHWQMLEIHTNQQEIKVEQQIPNDQYT